MCFYIHLDEVLLSVSEHRICFGAAIMTKCKYSITDFQRIKRIEIHRKEDSLVLNSTDNITGEAVLSVQMTEELFPNGEAAILCAVLFENGHDTERSKINFISIQSNLLNLQILLLCIFLCQVYIIYVIFTLH